MTATQLIKQFKNLPARERGKVAAYVVANREKRAEVKAKGRVTRSAVARKVAEAPRGALKPLPREIALSNTFGDTL